MALAKFCNRGTRVALWYLMLEPIIPVNADRDVISQIKLAFSNPLPLIIGALIGALVPLATYTVGHRELGSEGWASVPGMIVIGGCLFSAITVYKWGERAFGCAVKAAGFVVLSEGVMTFSQTFWLSLIVLGFLIAINAVANGANLAVAHLDAEARRGAQRYVAAVIVEAPTPAAGVSAAGVATALVEAPMTAEVAASIVLPSTIEPELEPARVTTAASTRRRSSKVKAIKATRGPRRASSAMLN